MTIRLKITLAFFVLFVCFCSISFVLREQQKDFSQTARSDLTHVGDIARNIYDSASIGLDYSLKTQLDWARFMAAHQGQETFIGDLASQDQMQRTEDDLGIAMERAMNDSERLLASQAKAQIDNIVNAPSHTIALDDIKTVNSSLVSLTKFYEAKALKERVSIDDFLDQSDSQFLAYMKKSEAILIGAIGILTISLLIYYFIIHTIIPPLRRASSIANSIAVGYLDNEIVVKGHSETDDLLKSLQMMQLSLSEANDRAEQSLRETETSYYKMAETSAALNDANVKLGLLNVSVNTMLDALGQGLFSFGADGVCSDVYSKACLLFFDGNPSGQKVSEFLKCPADEAQATDRLLEFMFQGNGLAVSPEELLALFPQKYTHSNDLSVSLSYRPIYYNNGSVQSVLVVATDHSAEEAALHLLDNREHEALRVLRISGNRNLFIQFYRSITDYCDSLNTPAFDWTSLKKIKLDIHTLKGNASIFHLQDVVNILHELETALDNAADLGEYKKHIIEALPSLLPAINKVHGQACSVLGKDFDRQGATRILSLASLKAQVALLKSLGVDEAVYKGFVTTLIGEPIHNKLEAFDVGIQELAERYDKGIAACRYTGENFPIYTEAYGALFATFTHIARNIIGHAVDEVETRKELGKGEKLAIVIHTEKFVRDAAEWCRLSFSDDGKGINVVELRAKLMDRGHTDVVASMSDQAVMNFIFDDGLSTKETADELSGRGIGLSAVKDELQKMGGNVSVTSQLLYNTKIMMEFPLVWA